MRSHEILHLPRLALIGAILVAAFAIQQTDAAQAKTVTGPNAKSPSGSIRCYVNQYGSGIECTGTGVVDPAVPNPDLDVYVALKNTGKAEFGQRGDYPGYPGKAKAVHRGDWWKPAKSTAKDIRCVNLASGWRCTNRSGHGFRIKKASTELLLKASTQRFLSSLSESKAWMRPLKA